MSNPNFLQEHADAIIAHVDRDAIRARKFKVAVDMINGSACVLDPYLFHALGVELIPMNNIPNGKFAHKPEPIKENLVAISDLVRKTGTDIGFAQDPDADRLVIVDENGEILSEEYTLALGVEAVMSKNEGGSVVINMSTSMMSSDIAKAHRGRCIRTKVGEANVVKGIIEEKAIIGGEGGGGIIYPAINLARDSFVSIALVLELMAKKRKTISECVLSLPKYEMRKDKIGLNEPIQDIYNKLKEKFINTEGSQMNDLDGLRIDFNDHSWIHVRPSNTEPVIRLIGEARTKQRLDDMFKEILSLIS